MSKNVTAIKNSCWRLFMVINVLALFQFQNLQILKPTVKQDQSRQRKTSTSEIQQRRGKGRTHRADFFTLASLPLFCKINQSPPPWHSLKYWACASASQHSQPGAQQQEQDSPLWLSLITNSQKHESMSFSHHIWSALRWPFMVQQIRGLFSAANLSVEDCFTIISDTPEAAVLF